MSLDKKNVEEKPHFCSSNWQFLFTKDKNTFTCFQIPTNPLSGQNQLESNCLNFPDRLHQRLLFSERAEPGGRLGSCLQWRTTPTWGRNSSWDLWLHCGFWSPQASQVVGLRKLSSWLVKLLLGKSALAAGGGEGGSGGDPWEGDFKKWFLFLLHSNLRVFFCWNNAF